MTDVDARRRVPVATGRPGGTVARAGLLLGRTVVAGGLVLRHAAGDPMVRLGSPAGRRDPYPVYADLRRRGPLVRTFAGFATARHDVARQVLVDHETFGSAPVPGPQRASALARLMFKVDADDVTARLRGRRVVTAGAYRDVPDPLGEDSLLQMDPPDHARLRRVVSRTFTPRAVAAVRARVEEVAEELLDRAPRQGFDVVADYAGVLPVVVIGELLGIPPADWPRVRAWGDVVASTLDLAGAAPPHVAAPALVELTAYFRRLVARRRNGGGDLVIDALIAEADSGALTERELLATAMLLMAAGFETTVNLIGNGTLALLRDPAARERLRARPDLAPDVVEEVLRHDSPVQLTTRCVRRDTDLHGVRLRRGDLVLVALGGANRDPAVFADPDRFDVGRTGAREHLSFSAGPHFCLGASLARMEGEVALRRLAERFPRWSPDGTVRRGRSIVLRGVEALPLRLG